MPIDFLNILDTLRDAILFPFEVVEFGHYYEYFSILIILSILLPLVLVVIKFLLGLRNVG